MKMISKTQLNKEVKEPTVKDYHNGSIEKFIKKQNYEWIDNYNNRKIIEASRPITTKAFIYERDIPL